MRVLALCLLATPAQAWDFTPTPVCTILNDTPELQALPLPEGFNPRQTTIHVRDRVDGKLLGMRVMYVK